MESSSGGMGEKNAHLGKQCAANPMESPASVTSDSSAHDTLLIHRMEQEAIAVGITCDEKNSQNDSEKGTQNAKCGGDAHNMKKILC